MTLRVEAYHDPYSGHGPWYRVVNDAGTTVPQEVAGCTYPADGFDTRKAAENWIKRNRK